MIDITALLKQIGIIKTDKQSLTDHLVSARKELAALESMNLTRDEYISQARSFIDDMAAKHKQHIPIQTKQMSGTTHPFDFVSIFSNVRSLTPEAFLYFCGDQVKEKLETLVDDWGIIFGDMPKAERTSRMTALRKDIKHAENQLSDIDAQLGAIRG